MVLAHQFGAVLVSKKNFVMLQLSSMLTSVTLPLSYDVSAVSLIGVVSGQNSIVMGSSVVLILVSVFVVVSKVESFNSVVFMKIGNSVANPLTDVYSVEILPVSGGCCEGATIVDSCTGGTTSVEPMKDSVVSSSSSSSSSVAVCDSTSIVISLCCAIVVSEVKVSVTPFSPVMGPLVLVSSATVCVLENTNTALTFAADDAVVTSDFGVIFKDVGNDVMDSPDSWMVSCGVMIVV